MKKIKEIVIIVFKFVLVLVLICLVVGLINCYQGKINFSELGSKIGLYFLYTIGYGAMEGEQALQNILAMVGIIWAALMTTYLTINLFWRFDDVKLEKNIEVKDNNLIFKFKNSGQDICDLKVSFILYNKDICENIGDTKEFNMPILLAKSTWNIQASIEDTFWYQALYNILSSDSKKLYCTFSFADIKTGQTSIKVEEINKDNLMLDYDTLIKPVIIKCNKLSACENKSRINISIVGNYCNMKYYFLNKENNSFAMVYYNFHENNLNLNKYNKENTYLEFKVNSMKKIIMYLEIKMVNNVDYKKEIILDGKEENIKINLKDIDVDNLLVREICFTIFKKDNDKEGKINISDLKIITK